MWKGTAASLKPSPTMINASPTHSAETIYRAAKPLLMGEIRHTAYRLIGVGVSGFAPLEAADLFDLADPEAPRRAKLVDAVDDLRDRFGTAVIGKGRGLNN